ncbi:Ras guanine nucleotide exchange factor Q [Pelomyxa schiedti]|nr:Ras guanine nucleotide exchange factor Q [Pelomyxa schiedti]
MTSILLYTSADDPPSGANPASSASSSSSSARRSGAASSSLSDELDASPQQQQQQHTMRHSSHRHRHRGERRSRSASGDPSPPSGPEGDGDGEPRGRVPDATTTVFVRSMCSAQADHGHGTVSGTGTGTAETAVPATASANATAAVIDSSVAVVTSGVPGVKPVLAHNLEHPSSNSPAIDDAQEGRPERAHTHRRHKSTLVTFVEKSPVVVQPQPPQPPVPVPQEPKVPPEQESQRASSDLSSDHDGSSSSSTIPSPTLTPTPTMAPSPSVITPPSSPTVRSTTPPRVSSPPAVIPPAAAPAPAPTPPAPLSNGRSSSSFARISSSPDVVLEETPEKKIMLDAHPTDELSASNELKPLSPSFSGKIISPRIRASPVSSEITELSKASSAPILSPSVSSITSTAPTSLPGSFQLYSSTSTSSPNILPPAPPPTSLPAQLPLGIITNQGKIIGGNADTLLNTLLYFEPRSNFCLTIVLTHHYFMPTEQFVESLIQKYDDPQTASVSSLYDQFNVRTRVIEVLVVWAQHARDISNKTSAEVSNMMVNFLVHKMLQQHNKYGDLLKGFLQIPLLESLAKEDSLVLLSAGDPSFKNMSSFASESCTLDRPERGFARRSGVRPLSTMANPKLGLLFQVKEIQHREKTDLGKVATLIKSSLICRTKQRKFKASKMVELLSHELEIPEDEAAAIGVDLLRRNIIKSTDKVIDFKPSKIYVFTVEDEQWPDPLVDKHIIENIRENKNFHVTDIDPTEIARQLTLVEHELLSSISIMELSDKKWENKEKRRRLAPHLTAYIENSNKISNWVASEIVKSKRDVKHRKAIITHFLEIAQRCREFRNWNAMVEITLGLQLRFVDRLKKTWELISRNENALLDELKSLAIGEKNYLLLREQIASVPPETPFLPYAALWLRDLVFIEDGNSTMKEADIVNYEKLEMLCDAFKALLRVKDVQYQFKALPVFKIFFKNLVATPDDQLNQLSLECEPRGG